jgi:outer membrane protein OmpA-like peptidoglycan-associated protein
MQVTPFVRRAPLLALIALAACTTRPVAPPPVPPPVTPAPMPAGTPVPAAPSAPPGAAAAGWSNDMELAASRLRNALRGSPVDVAQTTDQRLWVSFPAEQTFAPARPALTPAAGAWLDQVAAAVRATPRSTVQIVGPADPRGGSALALDRASSARDWIVARGVAPMRVTVTAQAPRPRAPASDARLEILIGERGPVR